MQLVLILLAQVATAQLPPPRGFVNDFAGVIEADRALRLERLLAAVREKTGGEITVVTLADLHGREPGELALQIGRQWGVGAKAEAGDPRKNLGVVLLLVPRRNHEPGTGAVFIATGRGAEGFLPDARVGRIRDAMTPNLAREDYGAGLEVGVGLLAQAFADAFHVMVSVPPAPPGPAPVQSGRPPRVVVLAAIIGFLILMAAIRASQSRRGRRFGGGWWFGGWGGGGWSVGGLGGGWGGGGGGGGFGGFGGGGGFSGGGAGGRF